jgi:hypothetical protein
MSELFRVLMLFIQYSKHIYQLEGLDSRRIFNNKKKLKINCNLNREKKASDTTGRDWHHLSKH